jgi:hypothetical protein
MELWGKGFLIIRNMPVIECYGHIMDFYYGHSVDSSVFTRVFAWHMGESSLFNMSV